MRLLGENGNKIAKRRTFATKDAPCGFLSAFAALFVPITKISRVGNLGNVQLAVLGLGDFHGTQLNGVGVGGVISSGGLHRGEG